MKLYTNKNVLIKVRTARRYRAFRRVWSVVIVVVITLIGLIIALNNATFNLSKVTIVGTVFVPEVEVAKIIDSNMSGSHFGIIPKRSFMFYPKEKIRQDILAKFYSISAVTFTEGSPSELLITVHEREPDAVWCEGEYKKNTERKCYYVDKFGYLYDIAPSFFGPVYFEYYGYLKHPPILGGKLFSEDQVVKIKRFRDELVTSKILPISILIRPDSSFELTTNGGWRILFSSSADIDLMMSHLKIALSSEIMVKRLSDKSNSLDYIDLRHGEKVFYKFYTPNSFNNSTEFSGTTSTTTYVQ